MQISITEKEYEAINFAIRKICTAPKESSGENSEAETKDFIKALYSVQSKYEIAQTKNRNLKEIKKQYLKFKPGTPDRIALKQARKIIRLTNEQKWREAINLTK